MKLSTRNRLPGTITEVVKGEAAEGNLQGQRKAHGRSHHA